MPVVNANSVDPDQTPRSAASDLGLHCLSLSHLFQVPLVMTLSNYYTVTIADPKYTHKHYENMPIQM